MCVCVCERESVRARERVCVWCPKMREECNPKTYPDMKEERKPNTCVCARESERGWHPEIKEERKPKTYEALRYQCMRP